MYEMRCEQGTSGGPPSWRTASTASRRFESEETVVILSDEDREALHAALTRSWESLGAGRIRNASAIIDRIAIVAHTDREDRVRIINAREVPRQNDAYMKKTSDKPVDDEMRPEYGLRGGVRGKYYERYQQGTNVVLLEPDIAKVFRDSATVNEALRQYLSEHGTPPAASKRRVG